MKSGCRHHQEAFVLTLSYLLAAVSFTSGKAAENAPISYYTQVRPILQANCQGCHQPARANGEYSMTSFQGLLKGGESETAAIVPGRPDESYLVKLITPDGGTAEMPKDKKPLAATEIELIRQWIAEGAVDDTPDNAKSRYDAQHPPVYTRAPVITAIDFSPDGNVLAIAGFHEVLLAKADGSELLARLVGMSERIESVRFSPDGKRLAVTGGLPCRMGEVQVWDVESRELKLSVPVTFDTVYGGNWSPDGKLIAFGCADNTMRAIDVETGEQALFLGAHDDWVQDTVFSRDGSHLISVSRDMTCKLTEVATQRFVDNITSITPGVLKGGITTVARHPERDEIVIGGADGVAKVYRVFRLTNRVIGDDANMIRRMPPMKGRIFSVAVSRDGKRFAAGSSLDGSGQVDVYSFEFDTAMPDEIKKINEKVVTSRSAEENKALDEYHTRDVRRIASVDVPQSAVYAVTFRPDGKLLAAAGSDGLVRIIDPTNGQLVSQFAPAPLSGQDDVAKSRLLPPAPAPEDNDAGEAFAGEEKLGVLQVEPSIVQLENRFAYAQLLVTGTLESGERIDVTRMANITLSSAVATVSRTGMLQPVDDGSATLRVELAGVSAEVPVTVAGTQSDFHANFRRDVAPVISRLGCNQGTCHGAAKGKNGFKLSLRGYDSVFDVRALTDDLASRRVNVASPDESLMLLKATGAVPHVGSQLIRPNDTYYEILRSWIVGGAKLDMSVPRVVGIEVFPKNPTISRPGGKQQIRIVATYSNGETRDVTREAFIESGNTEVAAAGPRGLMTAVRRGEAPILARFEGSYAATTLTVMGDRSGFVWQKPPTYGKIDELVSAKWEKMKIQPSGLCTDTEFIRRVYLDLTGLPPTAENVREFLEDKRDTKVKRDELVDRLVGGTDYVEYWTNKWSDLLQVNRKYLGEEGAKLFRDWIRNQLADNTPYDRFVQKILMASGSNRDNPAASYYKILRTPQDTMENTTHLFLAVRFNCNKCHDHPFERWTQDQYYQTAAFFARTGLKRDPASGNRMIGGTAVEGATPLFEVVFDQAEGDVTHERTGAVTAPRLPFECDYQVGKDASRRQQLTAWITSPDNRYFAKSYVNRLWGYLLGTGLMEPIDDIRAGNPPTNPELLDYLTHEFVDSGFNVHHVMRLICKSRTYQLSIETNQWNEDDKLNYSHAIARRLPAEVLYDAIYQVTGSVSRIPGLRPGIRAAELPDAGVKLPSGFLATLGKPPRESACECERSSGLQLGPVMALVSGPTVGEAIADADNAIAQLVKTETDDSKLVNELFMRILNRPAEPSEVRAALDSMKTIQTDHQALLERLKKREEDFAAVRPRLEKEREMAIAATKAELAAYEKELAPKLEERERLRAERIAKREAELKEYEATLPEKLAEWESKYQSTVEWIPLEPTALKASNGAKLIRDGDRSVRVEGSDKKGRYTVTVNTRLQGITGVRLEALTDQPLTGKGPGLDENGNFVLTELELTAAPRSNPDAASKVELHNGKADFTQPGFDVNQAVDGRSGDQTGWAIGDRGGLVHWATFETKQPVGHKDGTVLQFTLHQNHNAPKHRLGRFRISVTLDEAPVGLSLPEELKSLVASAADKRSDRQKERLLSYFRRVEPGILKKEKALADSRKPLPIDPGLKKLQEKLEYVSRPVVEDPRLVELRKDVEQSTRQVASRRLTGAQDLAWALINTPEFLFNH